MTLAKNRNPKDIPGDGTLESLLEKLVELARKFGEGRGLADGCY